MSQPVSPPLGRTPDLAPARLEDAGFSARYARGTMIGRGGMGEVYECRDLRIGRDVAMKVVRSTPSEEMGSADRDASVQTVSAPKLERFVREARVQGQLEHPAIVPVYDLGLGEDGLPFFTMKRLRGLSLADVLAAHKRKDADVMARFGKRKLLADFATICLAIDFAHERGVLHRDLKPGNIMLGDFGEVSVLDWGIAQVSVASDAVAPAMNATLGTQRGQILGTLGYASPEQLRATGPVDVRSDVYGLGAVLFEILCLEPLHTGETLAEVERSVQAGVAVAARLQASRQEVAPELAAICERAVALDPAKRHASARALYEAVEGYLAGDRDRKQRSELACKHAQSAAILVDQARSGDEKARAQAMLQAGRALALDSENAEAIGVLTTLLLEPPRQVPREVEEQLAENEATIVRRMAGEGTRVAIGSLLIVPLAAWMGIRDIRIVLGVVLSLLGIAVTCQIASRRLSPRAWKLVFPVNLLFNGAMFMLFTRFCGPLFMTPTLAISLVASGIVQFTGRDRMMVLGTVFVAILGSVLLELAGIVRPSYAFQDGGLLLLPNTVAFSPLATMVTLTLTSLLAIAGAANTLAHMTREVRDARRQMALQAWQLAQLLPEKARKPS